MELITRQWLEIGGKNPKLRHAYGPVLHSNDQVHGLVQDCSNRNALAMELLQYCTKPSMSKQKNTQL